MAVTDAQLAYAEEVAVEESVMPSRLLRNNCTDFAMLISIPFSVLF